MPRSLRRIYYRCSSVISEPETNFHGASSPSPTLLRLVGHSSSTQGDLPRLHCSRKLHGRHIANLSATSKTQRRPVPLLFGRSSDENQFRKCNLTTTPSVPKRGPTGLRNSNLERRGDSKDTVREPASYPSTLHLSENSYLRPTLRRHRHV